MILFRHLPGPHVSCLLLTRELSHHLLKSPLSLQLVLLAQPLILLHLLDLITELLIIYHASCIFLLHVHQYLALTCSCSCLTSCSSPVLLPATPATGKPFLLPSLSMSWYTVLLLNMSFFNNLPTFHSPSPPWTVKKGAVMSKLY